MSNQQYRIGGYRPGNKPTDIKYHATDRFSADQLPRKVDLREYMTEVEAQVGNSCVANAFVGAYEYLAKRNLGESADVSRLFVYYNARAQEDCTEVDCGSQMLCAIDSLIKHGACCEDLWPNDPSLICEEPDADAYEQAANFKILEAECIETDLARWRHTLAEGYPIAFALQTFDSFDAANRNRGRVPMPKPAEHRRETHGWHAMLCVGYSDPDRMFIVRNSWGVDWGDRGYCYLPYDYVIHPDYNGDDSWIIKAVNDLDFSADVWQDGNSVFADDDSLLLDDFYVRTGDPTGFVEALEAVCQDYMASEEDYYFDYEEVENDDDYIVTINNFNLTIEDPDLVLEDIECLCAEYAIDEDYHYSLATELDDAADEDDLDPDDAWLDLVTLGMSLISTGADAGHEPQAVDDDYDDDEASEAESNDSWLDAIASTIDECI
ncbi:C1 family peptidase [filamentous cyanobacterium LEGE 11480]|uniref:C1 family peptidase n=1 Tax=Romeriopsis navalis LEGE 11480 TaxID=2777977 RepID=A0A928VIY5_9CYAN|nr:C1 family peptidase [Romeriopsis navalis]MBE9029190.1 C1 family peptidase [Romeriopsis navalis LEGE 11480]